jgi:hypothetical protein
MAPPFVFSHLYFFAEEFRCSKRYPSNTFLDCHLSIARNAEQQEITIDHPKGHFWKTNPPTQGVNLR